MPTSSKKTQRKTVSRNENPKEEAESSQKQEQPQSKESPRQELEKKPDWFDPEASPGDILLRGKVQIISGGKEVVLTLPVSLLLPSLLDEAGVEDADVRFKEVVENALTAPLNRKMRALCRNKIREMEEGPDEDITQPESNSGFGRFLPPVEDPPKEKKDPASEEEFNEEEEEEQKAPDEEYQPLDND